MAPHHRSIRYSHGFSPLASATEGSFTRPIVDYFGREHVNPGARTRFLTDSLNVRIRLRYNALMSRSNIFMGLGVVRVDGETARTFDRSFGDAGTEWVALAFPDIRLRLVEVLMPVNASVAFAGIEIDANASIEAVAEPVRRRCVVVGDSNTQGYGPARPDCDWPFLLAEDFNWEVLNAGYGGYICYPYMATTIAEVDMDIAIYMIGTNDYLTQVPLAEFADRLRRWYDNFRSLKPHAPLVLVSPTHTTFSRPIPLENYRDEFRRLASAMSEDPGLQLIEGADLTEDNDSLLDGIHFNDLGAKRVADNLQGLLRV